MTSFESDRAYFEEQQVMTLFLQRMNDLLEAVKKENGSTWDRFQVDPRETDVVDLGHNSFLKIDNPHHEGEYKPLATADWIALWSPINIQAMMKMIEAHVAGVEAMRELGVEMYIAKEFLTFANQTLNYIYSQGERTPDGEILAKERTLEFR